MNKQNSPESVVSQRFAKSKREWHDLSHTLLASYASGFITPALVQPITGNTTVFLEMDHAVQTNPTVTPVFDSMRVNVRAFFYPQRLCMRGMYGNNYMELDEIESMPFPMVSYSSSALNSSTSTFCEVILPGSLLNRLGFPSSILGRQWTPMVKENSFYNLNRYLETTSPSQVLGSGSGTDVNMTFNMSPVVGYYDICARYLSNPYDPEIPAIRHKISFDTSALPVPGSNSVINLVNKDDTVEFYNLYDVRDWLLNVKGIVTSVNTGSSLPAQLSCFVKNSSIGVSARVRSGLIGPLGDLTQTVNATSVATYANYIEACANKSYQLGLWPSLYMDDVSSTYFDNEEIDKLMSINLGDDVESYRLGKSLWYRTFKSILRGKKLDDWIEIQFGSKLKTSDHPIFVGADHFNINFSDVVNSNGVQTGDGFTPLGAAAGRGNKGSQNKRRISFTAPEPGYLYVLIDLVPYVSYANAIPNWLDWKTFADYPLPSYAGRNFRDLRIGEILFTGSSADDYVVGKQPLYYDFMTSRDRVGGIFDTNLLDTYTFKKKFNDGNAPEDGFAGLIGTTYIQKGMYDYSFPDWGQNGGENFFIKSLFNLRLLQPIPNDVLNTRI